MVALRRMPARVFAVLLSLEPAIGALVGLALLGEVLGWSQFLGVAAVVAAALGATLVRPARPARADRPDPTRADGPDRPDRRGLPDRPGGAVGRAAGGVAGRGGILVRWAYVSNATDR
ncbi:EamA family transporter [Micromonospora sp. WMMD882]|uniref:EamA family transporter n=1 Tax=Micromonospora sp. WMMD882 TaxID=3015151 RepID=UPI00248C043F|nr:EamA family transporter [Micromonospora sp. WMMD882]WBB78110.1 EamA family transporter [Micromonospora sp. WMMD882]